MVNWKFRLMLHMFKSILPFFLLSACAEPLPLIVYDERKSSSDPEKELPEEVVAACDLWHVECEAVDDDDGSYGFLVIEIMKGGASNDQSGRNFIKGICRKSFWSKEDDRTLHGKPIFSSLDIIIAHELGHAFGLENHSMDRHNLMFPDPTDDDILKSQRKTVQDKMSNFVACK